MSPFGLGKPAATVEDYATWFHSEPKPIPGVLDFPNAQFANVMIEQVAEADPAFDKTGIYELEQEWQSLRSEIFGLAWGHAFSNRDNHLLGEGVVAKRVLTERKLWEIGEHYNQAAARSTEDIKLRTDRGRAAMAAFQNTYRAGMFNTWVEKQGADPDVAARVLNRLFTEDSWKAGWTVRRLLYTLLQRLGYVDVKGEVSLNVGGIEILQAHAIAVPRVGDELVRQDRLQGALARARRTVRVADRGGREEDRGAAQQRRGRRAHRHAQAVEGRERLPPVPRQGRKGRERAHESRHDVFRVPRARAAQVARSGHGRG